MWGTRSYGGGGAEAVEAWVQWVVVKDWICWIRFCRRPEC